MLISHSSYRYWFMSIVHSSHKPLPWFTFHLNPFQFIIIPLHKMVHDMANSFIKIQFKANTFHSNKQTSLIIIPKRPTIWKNTKFGNVNQSQPNLFSSQIPYPNSNHIFKFHFGPWLAIGIWMLQIPILIPWLSKPSCHELSKETDKPWCDWKPCCRMHHYLSYVTYITCNTSIKHENHDL